MLPNHWVDFVFPENLRSQTVWIDQFSKNRRSYLTGYAQAASKVRLFHSDDVHAQRSPQFAEDPRRCIPFDGWRSRFRFHGEEFIEGETYEVPPKDPKRVKSLQWGAYGKDQPEYAWTYKPMRLYDAIKSITLLYQAADRLNMEVDFIPQGGEFTDIEPGVGIHIAIFRLSRFDDAYYEEHFGKNPERLAELFEKSSLISNFHGEPVLTYKEMALGLSATHRTCSLLKKFAHENGLPSVGEIWADTSARGTNRTHRHQVKRTFRKGIFYKYSADCAIEVFTI